MGSVRIAIVDDHPIFRAGVARSLSEAGDFQLVGEGASYADAVRLAKQARPDILLLDISIPGGGLAALQTILETAPAQKVVMLTVSEAGGDVERAMKSGARGYILKGIEAEELAHTLARIASGEGYVSPTLSARLLAGQFQPGRPLVSPVLDERQRRILKMISLGRSNKQIALEFDLQEKTIKHQLTRIFAALGVSNRTEAAMAYRDLGDQEAGREAFERRA